MTDDDMWLVFRSSGGEEFAWHWRDLAGVLYAEVGELVGWAKERPPYACEESR